MNRSNISILILLLLGAALAIPLPKPLETADENGQIRYGNPDEWGNDILESDETRNIVNQTFLWPNKTLIYQIDSDSFNATELITINRAMETITNETQGCIQFRSKTDDDLDYVYVTDYSQCGAIVGYKAKGRQSLSLASFCFQHFGTIIHEFLHALGVNHEHTRPDRDDYVEYYEENVNPSAIRQFVKISPSNVTYDLPYDYGSVMHYSNNSFSRNGGLTLRPRASVTIGQRKKMSYLDVKKLMRAYNCPCA